MDRQFTVRYGMSMSLVQTQSKLSIHEIFKQSGVEFSCPFIADSVLGAQGLGYYHCEIESKLMLDIVQCQSCRHLILRILGTLFKSIKQSLNIEFLIGLAMASWIALVLRRQLRQVPVPLLSTAFGLLIYASYD